MFEVIVKTSGALVALIFLVKSALAGDSEKWASKRIALVLVSSLYSFISVMALSTEAQQEAGIHLLTVINAAIAFSVTLYVLWVILKSQDSQKKTRLYKWATDYLP